MEKIIRDNVHGEIVIEDKIFLDLINSPEFQRLRRIIQLGGGQFVFPGANHTRFSHCIGVYHIISKFLNNVSFSSQLSEHEKRIVKIAGLLHDLGHGPFSHTFESISNQKHENYTLDIILGDTNINKILKKYTIDPNEIVLIIDGKHTNQILNLLVSSQLDADRLDYLLRDGVNIGVSYSKIDLNWIIRNARIFNNKIVFLEKTVNAIEHYLLGRFHMFVQVYEHKVSVAFDQTFKMWFLRLKDLYKDGYKFKNEYYLIFLKDLMDEKILSLENYLRLDDYTMFEIIKNTKEEDDFILSDLSNRLITRKFLSAKIDIGEEEFNFKKNNFKYDFRYYFNIIKTKNIFIYREEKSAKDENIYILRSDNELIKLSEISKILNINMENINKNIYIFPKYNVE
ncbi:HD domain-containing protein [Spiroplasma taiwanense]|uniref:HD superfamily phosphohydrolase n=1 Tax=Spiroplasma taiwanense CT-1 TaxID=1276220 RepID=S5LV32_9MOLU|nr:HD domain-containing protein [Spiroplasma taiwanense]AGR41654.1 HD superfamily phosphohydrolase [Spiroplasma taiwanense CT-1]